MKSEPLDDVDLQIISALLQNGRASYSHIGAEVGLSPHGAADRVKRLMQARVITGFTAKVDLEAVGRTLDAMIDVRLLPSTKPEDFERRARKLTAVRQVLFVTGRFDYQLRVTCRHADELDHTIRDIRQNAGAAQTETRIVLRSSEYAPDVMRPAT